MPPLLALTAVCWCPAVASAQLPQAGWQDLFEAFQSAAEVANAVDASGNIYVIGNTQSDVFVRKYDVAGTVVWTQVFGTVAIDVLQDIAVDATGVVVAGYTGGAFPGNTNVGNFDAVIRKYDHDGNILWTRQLGTTRSDQLNSVALLGVDIYATGTTNVSAWPGQTAAGLDDGFVIKCDANGALVWVRQFGTTGAEDAQAIEAIGGTIYVSGRTTGALHGTSAGQSDIYLRAYDGAGNLQWGRQLGSTGTDLALSLAVEPAAVYVGGSTSGTMAGQTSSGSVDGLVARYSPGGLLQWVRQFGSTGSDDANGLAADGAGVWVGGVVAGTLPGQTNSGLSDAYVRRYDAAGTVVWTRQFGTSVTDRVMGLAAGSLDLIACGVTGGVFAGQLGSGAADAFLRAFDSAGTALWTRQFGFTTSVTVPDRAMAVGIGPDGCIYVAGWTVGLFPNAGMSGPAGGQDCYVRKYDPSGTLLWTRQFGTTGNDSAFDLVADETGVLVAGSVSVGGAPTSPTDAIVRKYNASGEELWTVQFGTPVADGATAIALHPGGFCVAGWTAGALHGQAPNGGEDAFVCRCDAAGNFVWTRLLGGALNDRASGLSVYDGNIFLATSEGFSAGSGVATGGGGFLARYDANGFAQWTRDVFAHGIDVNAGGVFACATGYSPRYQTDSVRLRRYGLDGVEDWVTEEPVYGSFLGGDLTAQAITAVGSRIYVAGGVEGSLRSEPGLGIQDTFILQFDNLGNPGWTYRVDHGGEDYARSIAYDDDRLLVAGARAVNNSGNPFAGSGSSYVATLQLGIGVVDSTPPVADAGMDQSIHVGVPVQLDGSASSDDTSPNEALVYDWELIAGPALETYITTFFRGSVIVFFPHDPGEFRFRLVVSDEQGNRSQPDEVVVSSLNLAPTADAGPDQIVLVGTQTAVDGLASYDPDQDSVTYAWTITSAPAGSAAMLAGFSAWRSFQPDLPGSYVLQLVVSDAWSSSVPDSMTIVAVTPTEFAQIKLQQACAQLHAMTAANFDAPGHQESLCNQLAQIVNFIQMPNLAHAQAHLTQAIARVDGWSLRNAFDPKGQGQPHAADFVVTEPEQRAVWVLLTDALALLQQ